MTIQELKSNSDYIQIAKIQHGEMKNFLIAEIEKQPKWAKIANMYQIGGFLAFIIGTFKAFLPLFANKGAENLHWLGMGIVFCFSLLIILHELIHAAAYLMIGARKLSFGMILKKFIFYVQADKQVINYTKFKIVALAPVISIAIVTIVGMLIFYNQPPFYFFLTIFGLHSIFCGGDFGLLCFFENRKNKHIVTFDDKDENSTYFFGKF